MRTEFKIINKQSGQVVAITDKEGQEGTHCIVCRFEKIPLFIIWTLAQNSKRGLTFINYGLTGKPVTIFFSRSLFLFKDVK